MSGVLPEREDSIDERIDSAELFEQELKLANGGVVPNDLQNSRVAAVLKLLHATLATGSTKSLNASSDSPLSFTIPARVGRFTVGEMIGRGGFGVVYKAHDDLLRRDVALKAVPRRISVQQASNDDYRLREARAAARLNHPSLVPLYEVFEDNEFLYLVSELCDGPNLAEYLKQNGAIQPDRAAEITFRLSQAIAHAHGRGLVHRDIKPSNVLMAPEHAETDLLPFTPRLTDFGLVIDTDNDPIVPTGRRLAGTILYMSPEQLRGDSNVDARGGDVYSLGLLLYQMLSGKLPYRSSSPAEMYREICDAPIPVITDSRFDISPDLQAIYMKALQKDVASRYPSAKSLADDLARLRDGREVESRPQSVFEKSYRQIRRSPLFFSLLLAFVCLLIASTAIIAWDNRLLREQSIDLQNAFIIASRSKRAAVEIAYRADMNQAFLALAKKDSATANSFVEEIEQNTGGGEEFRNRFDLRLLSTLVDDGWTQFSNFDARIEEIVLIPNSDEFVVAGGDTIRFHRVGSRNSTRKIELANGESIHSLAVMADASMLAIGVSEVKTAWSWLGYGSGRVQFIPLGDAVALKSLAGFDATIESLAFSEDGKRLAVGTRYEPLYLFDVHSDTAPTRLPSARRNEDLHFGVNDELAWIPETNQLLIHRTDRHHDKHRLEVEAIEYYHRMTRSGDGRWVAATLGESSHAYLYDLHREDADPIRLENQHGELRSIHISASGEYIAAGTVGGGVVVWTVGKEIQEGKQQSIPLARYHAIHDGPVQAIAVRDDGTIFAGSEDGGLAVSTRGDDARVRRVFNLDDQSTAAELTSDGRQAIVGCCDGTVWSIDMMTNERSELHETRDSIVTAVAISPDDLSAIVGWMDGTAKLCKLRRDSHWLPLPTPEHDPKIDFSVTDIQFNRSGERVSMVFQQTWLRWLELSESSSGDPTASLSASYHLPTSVEAVTLLDEETALTLGDHLRIIKAEGGITAPLVAGLTDVSCQCFDDVRGLIYVGCSDGRIRVLDASSQTLLTTSQRWTPTVVEPEVVRQITAITLSPDSRNLITGSDIGDVAIWDVASLRQLGPIWCANFEGEIERITVAGEGNVLFTHQRDFPLTGTKGNGRLRTLRLN